MKLCDGRVASIITLLVLSEYIQPCYEPFCTITLTANTRTITLACWVMTFSLFIYLRFVRTKTFLSIKATGFKFSIVVYKGHGIWLLIQFGQGKRSAYNHNSLLPQICRFSLKKNFYGCCLQQGKSMRKNIHSSLCHFSHEIWNGWLQSNSKLPVKIFPQKAHTILHTTDWRPLGDRRCSFTNNDVLNAVTKTTSVQVYSYRHVMSLQLKSDARFCRYMHVCLRCWWTDFILTRKN